MVEARFGRGRGPLLLVVTWVPSGESHAGFLSPFPRSSLILKLPTWGRWITRLRQELGREISDMAVGGRRPPRSSPQDPAVPPPPEAPHPHLPRIRPGARQTPRCRPRLSLLRPECRRPGLCQSRSHLWAAWHSLASQLASRPSAVPLAPFPSSSSLQSPRPRRVGGGCDLTGPLTGFQWALLLSAVPSFSL